MAELHRVIETALAEDIPGGHDITTDSFLDADITGTGCIEAREEAVVSGLEAVAAVFRTVDKGLFIHAVCKDGEQVSASSRVLELRGRASSILRGERTALNLLCHLSGIATATRAFVAAVEKWGTQILCTRKTLPGLRELEVTAVRHGGGDVYRVNLSDSVLLKDNHIAILGGMAGVRDRMEELRKENPDYANRLLREGKIEADSPEEVAAAADMGWRHILLDNFTPDEVIRVVDQWQGRVFLEISGGVTLSNVRDYASTGVNAISIGAITHSARAVDFSLDVEWRT